MTWKLALINVKKRWQDYLVLMMGLIISVSIFYMFQTLSLNVKFLEEVIPTISMVAFIFQLGAVLLGIITVVYIFYANSFLLSMRKKEYGMYMMLGAKKKKIKQMMTIETLFIGFLSMVVGIMLGVVFSTIMSQVLLNQLRVSSNQYNAFSFSAVVVTFIFFLILFVLTAITNASKFSKTKLLDLLHEDQQSEKHRPNKLKTISLTIVSVILIMIGYFSLWHVKELALAGLVIALFTITFGTFLFFAALLPAVISAFKNNEKFSRKGIRIFTLSQLSFKSSSLSKVLGMVTMLLALSLGAITVGDAFNNYKEALIKQAPYDAVIFNPDEAVSKEMAKLEGKEERLYHIKQNNEEFYFLYDELREQPITMNNQTGFTLKAKPFTEFNEGDSFSTNNGTEFSIMSAFGQIMNPYTSYLNAPVYHVVSQSEFDQAQGESGVIHVLMVDDFEGQLDIFERIDTLEMARFDLEDAETSNSKFALYSMISMMVSGFMFMGAFLGIAFLAMLASSLMFKILSGAYQDIGRYDMLRKIGVGKKKLLASIYKEILVVFAVPGILGTIHVLFGLKMFELLMPEPYSHIWLPFVIFAAIYLLYYFITVKLYQNIVLKSEKNQ
ncbi:FtsX-like permease family protein [Vagococcus elongatus]|uniref:ABC3 transporter permease C-terminal domain-containing protein n=1 Tax=Vagococcus elongatus TaxID=180344 RepID=A0A430AQ29_9ENTE|nr:ABC transporter permease [Vagococcus elongatus]RSU10165.1 hypothetical protein CBF29_10275 [Vagococcus elongatus]